MSRLSNRIERRSRAPTDPLSVGVVFACNAALSLCGPGTGRPEPRRVPGLHRDGLNDDSPAVAAALSDAMRNHQALYVPSGGPILLAGGARLPRLDDVALIGDGVQDGGPPPYGRRGSTFWIIDDTEFAF